ncbi:MAG: DUF433 domain-containing protein [Bacteroidetes bacterium]|jgi:uncharacterized protein (DUF433 family)|nr:DUF433 domain-containing protein [Bacteroidota bacterium]
MPVSITSLPAPLRIDDDGVLRVRDTRVPLDSVVVAFQQGATPEDIAQQFPALSLPDVYATIGYYLQRRGDLDAYLHAREAEAETLRQEITLRSDLADTRERLLARQQTG